MECDGETEEDCWRLEPEGETETAETKVIRSEVEGVPGYPDGDGRHEQVQVKSSRMEWKAKHQGKKVNVKIPVFSSAIVIDVIEHCHTAGAL